MYAGVVHLVKGCLVLRHLLKPIQSVSIEIASASAIKRCIPARSSVMMVIVVE